jgi:DNA phosphorothioation-dependent restriction protein DptG
MAYFAKLGTGNIVEQVISINNAVITDANGVEQEQLGVDFINKLYNTRDVWKQTSYNGNIRKNYAGIGFQYDQTRDAFIPPKP